MTDYLFELDGGRPCLDFANTLSSSGEHLNTYADLVAFAAQSNLITRADAVWLQTEAGRDPESAEGVFERARRLRAAIYAIFSAVVHDSEPSKHDLDVLNDDLAKSLSHARVLPDDSRRRFHWGWSGRDLAAPLWPITRSAADLLTSDSERQLVRECSGSECNWLFMDTSKNRTRQWCSMQSCGNREKARRHYQRLRAKRIA